MNAEISVRKAISTVEGSCNGCSQHTTAEGSVSHKVYLVDLRSMSFRLCESCRLELIAKLKLK